MDNAAPSEAPGGIERRRWGRLRLGLRAQLALQVVLGAFWVVVAFLILRNYVVNEELDRTSRERLAVAQVLGGYVDVQLAAGLQELARTAARIQTSDAAGAQPLLEDLHSRIDPSAYGVFLLDPSGKPIAADPPAIGPAGAALFQRPEVNRELAAGRATVSGVHSGADGQAQFGMVVPARIPWLSSPGGNAVGTVGVLIDPTNPRFTELVDASLSLGGDATAEVVDQFGVVVASTQRERSLLPGQFPDLYTARLAARIPGWEAATPPEGPNAGEPFLVAFAPLQRAPWGLALAGPEATVLAPLRRLDPPLIALTISAVGILMLLAAMTARSVVNPVRTLIAAARRMALGDLESEVPHAGGGELRQLARALDEMRGDLRRAELNRAEVDRVKDEFVSSVSHELRTPLGYIKGYTTTLLRRDTKWDERQVRRFLKIIDESSDQLEGLVDHLLDMSRISEGRLSVHPEPVALTPIVRDVARRANVGSAEHKIVVSVPNELPLVMADRGRVMQVLGNLVDNAIKYSPAGGRITIGAAVSGHEVTVTIRDEGIGIPPDQLERVFDRFHRVANPRVGQIRGTGLGLPICRAIVEAHGGRIWAEIPPDHQGALLRFTLPLAAMEEPTRPRPEPQTEAAS